MDGKTDGWMEAFAISLLLKHGDKNVDEETSIYSSIASIVIYNTTSL